MRVMNKSTAQFSRPLLGRGILLPKMARGMRRGCGMLPYMGKGKMLPYAGKGCSYGKGMMPYSGKGQSKKMSRIGGQYFKAVNTNNLPKEYVGPQSSGPLA